MVGARRAGRVSPGTRSATAFWTWFAFCGLLFGQQRVKGEESKKWYSHRYGASLAAVALSFMGFAKSILSLVCIL